MQVYEGMCSITLLHHVCQQVKDGYAHVVIEYIRYSYYSIVFMN